MLFERLQPLFQRFIKVCRSPCLVSAPWAQESPSWRSFPHTGKYISPELFERM